MSEEIKFIMDMAKEGMESAITHLEAGLSKIRAGKASPTMLEGIMVDYYGSKSPISQVASVNTQDSRSLVVQPWEKGMLTPIEKAIQAANLGLNPQNDGVLIRIIVPALTEERRKDLVKKAKAEAEDAKVGLRGARKEAIDEIKNYKNQDCQKMKQKVQKQMCRNLQIPILKKLKNI